MEGILPMRGSVSTACAACCLVVSIRMVSYFSIEGSKFNGRATAVAKRRWRTEAGQHSTHLTVRHFSRKDPIVSELKSFCQEYLRYRSTGRGTGISDCQQCSNSDQRKARISLPSMDGDPRDVQGLLKTAAQCKRAPAELLSLLPEPKDLPVNYPRTGVYLLSRR
jgi:hypothetical protein